MENTEIEDHKKKADNVIKQGEVPGNCNDVAMSGECLSFAKV